MRWYVTLAIDLGLLGVALALVLTRQTGALSTVIGAVVAIALNHRQPRAPQPPTLLSGVIEAAPPTLPPPVTPAALTVLSGGR